MIHIVYCTLLISLALLAASLYQARNFWREKARQESAENKNAFRRICQAISDGEARMVDYNRRGPAEKIKVHMAGRTEDYGSQEVMFEVYIDGNRLLLHIMVKPRVMLWPD